MNQRITRLRSAFDALNIDAFLITFLPHLRYMTGFTGSNGVGLVTHRGLYLLTDGRYEEQVKKEAIGWTTDIAHDYNILDLIRKKKYFRAGMRIGFDGNTITLAQFKNFKKQFPKVHFRPRAEVIEKIAVSKDESELALLQQAIDITDKVFHDILPLIKPGVTEADIAAEITYRHKKYGASTDAFEPIVASGTQGALPHARATAKKMAKGEMVTLDFGCVYKGYHSDLTRTIAIGKPPKEMHKIYDIVLAAQCKAIESAHSGMTGKELDAVAREHIKQSGYEKHFQHSLGHGIGLQIHEPPKVSFLNGNPLPEHCVITIEPGIYVPNLGGVRIEDDVLLTSKGATVLTRSPKELIVV